VRAGHDQDLHRGRGAALAEARERRRGFREASIRNERDVSRAAGSCPPVSDSKHLSADVRLTARPSSSVWLLSLTTRRDDRHRASRNRDDADRYALGSNEQKPRTRDAEEQNRGQKAEFIFYF
jgi:hypothetical protein